jgi:hypothetical protein
LEFLLLKRYLVDQIVIITDGDENSPVGGFAQVYPIYAKEMGTRPSVVVIRVGDWKPVFVDSLKRAGIEHEVYEPGQADYYSLPGLIPLLSKNSKLDLLMEIMDTPLLKRKPFPEGKKRS